MRATNRQFEQLENRAMLSTVNVMDYGAVPNDSKSDDNAIRAAIKDSDGGDTIYFPAGTYDLKDSINPPGDRNFAGDDGDSTLRGDPGTHIFKIHQDNIRIEGFTFDGKPIFLDKPGNRMVEDIVINNNTFHLNAEGEGDNGITFTTGLRNCRITNNTFDPMNGDNGVYGYYWDDLVIANNEFLNGNEGIHIVDHSNDSRDLLIEQNYFSGLRRMGIEYQGGGKNTVVQDNYYENPVMTDNFSDNNSTFAYSIIADTSVDTIVRRNTSIAPQRPDGTGVRIVFEVGGDNCVVEDNYSVGGNHILAANDGQGSTSVLARNNRWSGYLQNASGRGLTLKNNGGDVELTWDIDRGKPGPFKRLTLDGWTQVEGASSGSGSTGGSSKPAPAKPVTDNGLIYLSDLNWVSADNGWGPVEINRSVGGKKAGDGDVLRLDGKTYASGLGAAINSEIVYSLNGNYAKFFSDIGIDDSVGNSGSATFEVWADGRKVFDSGVMRGSDATRSLSLNVAGVKKLKLVTTNGGDGDRNDRVDWASPRLSPA